MAFSGGCEVPSMRSRRRRLLTKQDRAVFMTGGSGVVCGGWYGPKNAFSVTVGFSDHYIGKICEFLKDSASRGNILKVSLKKSKLPRKSHQH